MIERTCNTAVHDWLLNEPTDTPISLPESIDMDLMFWNNPTPASVTEFDSIDCLFLNNSILPLLSNASLASRKWRAAKSTQVTQLDNLIQQLQDEKMALEKYAAVLESVAATFGPRELELKQRIAVLEGRLGEICSSMVES
ncbi:hypothetical protein HDU98_006719 [Podochytrium sp. JEL0797]|nr:hypothetical protein HDU98_006719 [Podochytrium sp. JEL0797]